MLRLSMAFAALLVNKGNYICFLEYYGYKVQCSLDASAALLLSEDFNYPSGELAAQNGGTGEV
jgi:hypothetical protein